MSRGRFGSGADLSDYRIFDIADLTGHFVVKLSFSLLSVCFQI